VKNTRPKRRRKRKKRRKRRQNLNQNKERIPWKQEFEHRITIMLHNLGTLGLHLLLTIFRKLHIIVYRS